MNAFIPLIIIMALTFNANSFGQAKSNYLRIAKLVIDSAKIDDYKTALKEHAEIAVKVEPGVLMLYAVYEKENPTRVSVFEIYASKEAYNSHIKTSHFLKYKERVKNMVKSIELIDVVPIALESKHQNSN